MGTTREIISLQFGNRSNTVGANVWNLRHQTPSTSQCFYDVRKRPRVLIFDLKSNIKNPSISKEETSKIVGGLVSSSVQPVWKGSIACIDRSAETSTSSSSWLQSTKDDMTSNTFQLTSFGDFDVYSEGVALYKKRGAYGTSIGEDAFDRVRRTLEACDAIQGFMISIDLNSAFGGFATEMIVDIRDECPSVSRCAFGILPSRDEDIATAKEISRRGLNVGFTTAALAEHCSLWIPIDSTRNEVTAHAIDTFSSPFRFQNERVSPIVNSLVPRPHMNLITLSTCVMKEKRESFVWDKTKLESLLRIRDSTEKYDDDDDDDDKRRVRYYGMYSVFRTRDDRDKDLVSFESYARKQCRRVKTCRVSEEIPWNKENEDNEEVSSKDEEDEEDTIHAVDSTKISTFRTCALATNSSESNEFLNEISSQFSKKREHAGMLRYFAETGLDTEEYNDVSESLNNLYRTYSI